MVCRMMSGARVLEPLVVLAMAYLSYLTGTHSQASHQYRNTTSLLDIHS